MDDAKLIAAMIAGIAADPPWRAFVKALREAFEASHANVIFRRSDLTQAFMTASSSPEVERFGDLRARHDPDRDPISYYEMLPFRPYEIGEFLTHTGPPGHPFLDDFLRPLGMEHLVICRVVAGDELQAWISVARAGAPFTTADKARLAGLSRTFAEALGVFGRLKSAQEQREAYARAMRARATGLIQLDQNGLVIHLDDQARSWVDDGAILRATNARLRTASARDRDPFENALGRVLRDESAEEFLALGEDEEMLELLICRTAEPFEPAWTHGSRAVIYLAMVGRESVPNLQRLMKLFGLTPREAALAQKLNGGLTLGEAAGTLGISEQTARAYLRQVFQKAGVTRQADLIRRMQGSLAGLT